MTGQQVGPAAPFAAHVARNGGRTLVRLIGELDVAVVEQAERAIALAELRHPQVLEVDLSTLAFMDSTGLRLILQARRRARDEGRRLLLHRGPHAVQRVLEVAAVLPLFEFVD